MSARPVSATLGALIDELAETRPYAEAVVFGDQRLTYGALRTQVDELARGLLAVGVGRGDRVGVLLPNQPEWIVAALSTAKIGAVVAAISTFSTPRELEWALDHSGATVLVTLEAFRGRHYL